LDTSFDTSDGPNGDVLSLAIRTDGSVVIAGAFTAVGEVARPGIACLLGNVLAPTPPTILTPPQSVQVAHGNDVTLTVEASGTLPLAYQWYKDGGVLSGATSSALHLPRVQPGDAGAYGVVITNTVGTATGGPVSAVIDGGPVVLVQPVDATAAEGGTARFSVQAAGPGPITFRWLHDGGEMTDDANVQGLATTNLLLHDVRSSAQGNYSVRVTNPFGTASSRAAKLVTTPANDGFATPVVLGELGDRVYADTRSATKEPGEPEHAGEAGGHSVWFRWTAPLAGVVNVDTLGSEFDTLLAVYRGTNMTSLAFIAANDDGVGFGGNSRLEFLAEAGVTYILAVDGYQGAAGYAVLDLAYREPVLVDATTADGNWRFGVIAPAWSILVIEASDNLRTWVPVATNRVPAGGLPARFDFPPVPAAPRFYRALSQ
jgi:hypothetical protein